MKDDKNYWENDRKKCENDSLAEMVYCIYDHIDAFKFCEGCNLSNYNRDCKNNKIN